MLTLFCLGAILFSAPTWATTWNWALSGSTLPGGTGTFSGCESTTKTLITGNYSMSSTGLVHMTSPACSNNCTVTSGACSSCSSSSSGSCSAIPSDIYGIELAGVHLIVQPVLTSPAETQPIYNVVTGSCPTASTTTYNFIFLQWSNTNDTSNANQIGVGTFTWALGTPDVATVASDYNLTAFGSIGDSFTLPNSGCTSGEIPVTGTTGGDRNGTIYISNEGEFFYQTSANHAVFGIPQVTVNNTSELTGSYSGFVYDASGSNTVVPITQIYVGPSGTTLSGYKMTGDSTYDTTFTRSFTFGTSGVNQPVTGMIQGTVSDGTHSSNMICATDLGRYNYNQLFCSAQEPGSTNTPYNMLLIQSPQQDLSSLRGNWDAEFGPQSGTTWSDSTSSANSCTLNSGVSWTGGGTSSSPYAINFSSTNSGADFGSSVLGGGTPQTHVLFDLWASSGTAGTGDQVILGDSNDATGDGFTLRQSKSQSGKLELVVGKTYQDIVLADNPVGYWRLGEASGTTAYDISANTNNGTYGSVTLGQTGALVGDGSTATLSDSSTIISVSDGSALDMTSALSIEAWIQASSWSSYDPGISKGSNWAQYGLIQWNGGSGAFALVLNGAATLIGGTTVPSVDTWYYVVGTYDGSYLKIYVNGTAEGTPVAYSQPIPTGTGSLTVGADYLTMQEVAIYNYALTPTQISNHYNAGKGDYGGICYSQSTFASNVWNFLGGLYDGTNATLFVNGRQECQVAAPSSYFSPPASDLFAGSTSTGGSPWQGELTDLQVYGTSDGSSVGSATNIKSNFDASADKFRSTPVGNIAMNGLVLNFDAANSARGLAFPGTGCSVTSWFDLSPSNITGSLNSFTNCGTYGWQGSGTVSSPYDLVFDGSASYVSAPDNANLDTTSAVTIEVWAKANSPGSYAYLLSKDFDSSVSSYALYTGLSGGLMFYMTVSGDGVSRSADAGTSYWDNHWHQFVGSYDGSDLYTFVDGAQVGSSVAGPGSSIQVSSQPLTIGSYLNGTLLFNGSIAISRVYNRALSSNEISQNCKAQQSRFSSSAICN